MNNENSDDECEKSQGESVGENESQNGHVEYFSKKRSSSKRWVH